MAKFNFKSAVMRINIIRGIIFFSLVSASTPFSFAANSTPAVSTTPDKNIYEKLAALKIKDIQKLVGRKLNLKEKITFFILKQKLRHRPKESEHRGETSLIFGIIGPMFLLLTFLWPPLLFCSLAAAIVAIVTGSSALKKNKLDNMAYAGKLLGWITLGLVGLFIILIIIAIATLGLY